MTRTRTPNNYDINSDPPLTMVEKTLVAELYGMAQREGAPALMARLYREVIRYAITANAGSKTEAASTLKMDRPNLYRQGIWGAKKKPRRQ
jgi:DNA-binding NtrC family response regulator